MLIKFGWLFFGQLCYSWWSIGESWKSEFIVHWVIDSQLSFHQKCHKILLDSWSDQTIKMKDTTKINDRPFHELVHSEISPWPTLDFRGHEFFYYNFKFQKSVSKLRAREYKTWKSWNFASGIFPRNFRRLTFPSITVPFLHRIQSERHFYAMNNGWNFVETYMRDAQGEF